MKHRQSGFTLVEIAIVLVIIGLLLGGVLKGQEMIANAKYKSLRSEIQSYAAAFYSFQDRYRALPGDFNQASTKLDPAAPNGNGAGTIGGGLCNAAGDESCMVWQHLRYAGLISGDPTATGNNANPNHPYGGPYRGIYSGSNGGRSGIWLIVQNLSTDVAQRLDEDMDDGVANAGSVFCANCGGANYPANRTNLQLRVLF